MGQKIIKWLGHAGFQITSEKGKIIVIDPWLTDNPLASCKAEDITKADFVLVTHDHFDHVADAARIVKATGATLVGMPETVGRLKDEEGVPDSQIVFGTGMNIGGTASSDGISITMTQAFHSSQTGSPAGYIIKLEDGFTVYHAGDTGIFSSMKLLGDLFKIDLALLPIGGVFTMDPKQASVAAKLLEAKTVIPMHYKTFPILEQDASLFAEIMGKEASHIQVVILDPGQEHTFS
ncbi:MAG TPA: metal-dependent hydrolase [Desulfatiglandales bacterium]|nr:metal-dependent hydrolase [Desulfatiglandales bacterium]